MRKAGPGLDATFQQDPVRREGIYLDCTETDYQLQEHSLGVWGLPLFVL